MYFTGMSLYPDGLMADIAAALISIPEGGTDPYWDDVTSDAPSAANLYRRVFKSRARVASPDERPLYCVIGALSTDAGFNQTASISGYTQNNVNSNIGLSLGGAQDYTPGAAGSPGTLTELVEQSLFLKNGVMPTNSGVGNVEWHLIVEPNFIALGISVVGDPNARSFGYFGALIPLENHPDGVPVICQSTTQNPSFSRAFTSVIGPYNYVNKNFYWCQGSYDPYMDIGHTRKLFLRSIPGYFYDGVNPLNTVPLGVLTNTYTSRFDRKNIRVLGTDGFASAVDTGEKNYLIVFPYPIDSIYTPKSGVGTPVDGFRMRQQISTGMDDYAIVVRFTP